MLTAPSVHVGFFVTEYFWASSYKAGVNTLLGNSVCKSLTHLEISVYKDLLLRKLVTFIAACICLITSSSLDELLGPGATYLSTKNGSMCYFYPLFPFSIFTFVAPPINYWAEYLSHKAKPVRVSRSLPTVAKSGCSCGICIL